LYSDGGCHEDVARILKTNNMKKSLSPSMKRRRNHCVA